MKLYVPNMYKKSVLDIPYNKLKKDNIKYLFFDLDNTIVRYDKDVVEAEIVKLLKNLNKDFKVIIISNSRKKRVSKIVDRLNIDYIFFAMKPLSFKLNKYLIKKDIKKENCVIIGDQLLTDIKLGSKLNIKTILIDQLVNNDLKLTKINRILEKYQYKHNNKLNKGEYYE